MLKMNGLWLLLVLASVAQADEVVNRMGLPPRDQSTLNRVMMRDRIGYDNKPHQTSSSTGSAMNTSCATDIGNVDYSKKKAGTPALKQNIVVIKGPVVNSCK